MERDYEWIEVVFRAGSEADAELLRVTSIQIVRCLQKQE